MGDNYQEYQKVIISDTGRDLSGVDGVTHSLTTIDVPHHEVHEGEHYIAHAYGTNKTTWDLLAVAPNTSTRCHLVFEVVSSSTALFQLFAEPTATPGTAITAYNNERNSSNTASLSLSHTPTGVTTGTKILYTGILSAGTRVAATSRSDWELILKQGQSYLFRVTASPAVDAVIRVSWYEEA